MNDDNIFIDKFGSLIVRSGARYELLSNATIMSVGNFIVYKFSDDVYVDIHTHTDVARLRVNGIVYYGESVLTFLIGLNL